MHKDPLASRAIIDSTNRIENAYSRSIQSNKCIADSLEAIAKTIVAASNYHASTKYSPPAIADKPKSKWILD